MCAAPLCLEMFLIMVYKEASLVTRTMGDPIRNCSRLHEDRYLLHGAVLYQAKP